MTALSQITAGARLTAAMLRGVAPLAVIKGADESVTSSTTLQNDDALFLPLEANASYIWLLVPFYLANSGTGDMKAGPVVPSGATVDWTVIHMGSSDTFLLDTGSSSGAVNLFHGNGATLRSALLAGTAVTSSTSGNLQFQWAQNGVSGTATTVKAGSLIAAWRIS